MARRRIPAERVIYEFAPDLDGEWSVEPGTSLTVETMDSTNGEITSEDDLVEDVPDEVNGATGPIEVVGAEPGDVLAVRIEDVRVREQGHVLTIPGFGLLQDDAELEAPRTRVTPVEDGTLAFDDVSVPVDPVIGTIGVAPESETFSTLVPHDHGGNLDTTDVAAGSTVYFPVFQDGAMLAMGDCKAAMADGEMCGTGAEIATEIDLTVDLIRSPGYEPARPLVETADAWKPLASAETLEEACRLANRDATELLAAEHGLDFTDAHMLSSLVGGLEISQVVDPLVTVRNAIPKTHLPDPFA